MRDVQMETRASTGTERHAVPTRGAAGLHRVLVAALLAMGLAAAVWALAVPVAGVDLVVGSGDRLQTVGLASILVVSAVAVFAGALTRRVLVRRARGVVMWNVLAVAVLGLSLAGPAGAATSGAWIALTCLHLTVGLVVLAGQRWTAGRLERA